MVLNNQGDSNVQTRFFKNQREVQSNSPPYVSGGVSDSFDKWHMTEMTLSGFRGWFVKGHMVLLTRTFTVATLGYHGRSLTMLRLPCVAHSEATCRPSGWQSQLRSYPSPEVRQVSAWNSG